MKKIGIIGAHGYSGRELARLLLQHPAAELSAVFTTAAGWNMSDDWVTSATEAVTTFSLNELTEQSRHLDGICLATPAEVSAELIKKLENYPGFIIDLSGAFRLNDANFDYGLTPWNKKIIKNSRRIANPGCYATAALMSLLPLLTIPVINPRGIIIDAKSGLSGAGRQANPANLFCEIYNDFFPYKVDSHAHTPEIKHYCTELADCPIDFTMINYVLPIHRGIHLTIYADAADSTRSPEQTLQTIAAAYDQAYQHYPLVKHSVYHENKNSLKHLKTVAGSARTHINYHLSTNKIIIFATIDNLMKGAASQAIENINNLLGLPLETGLFSQEGLL